MLVGDGWLYLPQPGYGGAWHWTPVALRDRVTGRLYPLLVGLLAALAAEEAHTNQPAPDHDTRRYCYEGQRLREDVRRLRREAERALREETAA